MASATGVVVGTRVRSRGRVGGVVSVDEVRSLVTVKFDDAKVVSRNGIPDESLSEGDSVVGAAEVEVLPVPSAEDVRLDRVRQDEERAASKAGQARQARDEFAKPDGHLTVGPARMPTQAQITAARRVALEKGKREGFGAKKLLDVQDEAEAELVARIERGEAA